ncbi:hypothetical protein [Bacillus sp. ISL-4]|nr:hypothetical protein [Bacillus sp. ISL-4]
MNLDQILVKFIHILVNLNVTQEFERFTHKIGANIREIGRLLVK